MIRFSAIALAAGIAAAASSAMAQTRGLEAGMLECAGTTSSFVVGSVTELRCSFRTGGRVDSYVATIRRVGVDIALPANVGMAWAVFNPTGRVGPGDLTGTYVGASASATAVVGVGANALIGGSNNTIALQPASVQGQTGLGAAAGVAGMELRAAR